MRRRRMWIVLLLALISGLAAAYLALNFLRQPVSPIRSAEAATTEVVVAARDLPFGTVVGAEDVKLLEWPAEAVPVGFSASVEEVLGRGLLTPVALNEPLLSGKLAEKDAGGGLPLAIDPGMRAVSVRVNEVVAVAGFVTTGTRVDVLVTVSQGDRQDDPITKVVLQDVPVLAADQQYTENAERQPQVVTVITLLVTPEDAEKLVLASTEGEIQLALRNTLDGDSITTEGAEIDDLLPNSRPAPAPRRVVRRRSPPTNTASRVEVWRGPEVQTTTVVSEGGSR